MFGLKTTELLLILVVVMLLFGATRLPQLGSSLGSAIRNFKKGFGGEEETPPAKGAASGASLASETSVDAKERVASKES